MTDEAQPPDPAITADCPRAREVLAVFVGGGIEVEDERWLRSHLTACPECRDAYRESIKSAAPLGRARRSRRLEDKRQLRQDAMRSRAMAVGEAGKRGRFFGLRIVALMVGVILILTWLNPSFNRPEVVVRWEAGTVRLGEISLESSRPEGIMTAGDACATEAASAARIDTGRGTLRIGPRTQVFVVDPKRARVRLTRGTLESEGPAVVESQYGIARIDGGKSRLDLVRGELEIACLEGEIEWVHPAGSQTLEAGDTARARVPGELSIVR